MGGIAARSTLIPTGTPLPTPPPQGGREHTEFAARRISIKTPHEVSLIEAGCAGVRQPVPHVASRHRATGRAPAMRHTCASPSRNPFPDQFLVLHEAGVEPAWRAQHQPAVDERDRAHLVAADAACVGRGTTRVVSVVPSKLSLPGIGHVLPRLARRQLGAAVAQDAHHAAVGLEGDEALGLRSVRRRQRPAVVVLPLGAAERPELRRCGCRCSSCVSRAMQGGADHNATPALVMIDTLEAGRFPPPPLHSSIDPETWMAGTSAA